MQDNNTGKKLSRQQKNVLNFIREYVRKYRTAPTQTEIAKHFGVQCSTITRHVQALRALNEIERIPGAHGLLVPEQTSGSFCSECNRTVNVCNNINQGALPENGVVMLNDKMIKHCPAEEFMACRISDDAMFDIGIHSGDIVLAVPVSCKSPRPGDLVVVATDEGSFTVRSFYPSGKYFELIPACSETDTQRHLYRNGIILGTIIQLIRNF